MWPAKDWRDGKEPPKPDECWHKWVNLKRWTDHIGFHAVQRCRRCDSYRELKMAMDMESRRKNPHLTVLGLEKVIQDGINPKLEIVPHQTNDK